MITQENAQVAIETQTAWSKFEGRLTIDCALKYAKFDNLESAIEFKKMFPGYTVTYMNL